MRFLLTLVSFAALPVFAAQWVPSAQAPLVPKAVQAESFRLAPGAKSAQRIELGEADAGEIAAVKQANSEQFAKRLQIGIGRKPNAGSAADSGSLVWERVPGGVAAHWEIASTGAMALRIALDIASLPATAQLRFGGSGDTGTVYGPFGSTDIGDGTAAYWSPVLEGERATVEVFVADAAEVGDVAMTVAWVSHIFASPSAANLDSLAKESQACEVDFICRAATDAALANIGKAVARMTFSDGAGGGTSLCTGTLLNTANGPVAPYFYTAAHCISTQASASTLTTHWFYDRTACGSGGTSASYVQVAGGAALLYANASSDANLMRLNQNPPAGAVYAGWDANTVAVGTALTAVHHPAGDLKKVSLGRMDGFGSSSLASGSFLVARWNSTTTGVTEGGSSGSGIFTASGSPATQYLLRGGLLGGPSSCTAPTSELYDHYSRLDQVYACIAEHLSPASGCSYSLSSGSASPGAAASSGSFSVSTSSSCSWGATSQVSWITTNNCGTGSGTVSYSVAANTGSAARTGTITVGGQTYTITQAAQSGGNVLANSGFESGASSWTESATSGQAIITSSASGAHSGSGYAWLGGYVSGTDIIYQNVAIPAGASPVTLQFWYRILTAETSTSSAFDTLRVAIHNPTTGAVLANVASASNLNATSSWAQSQTFDLSAFAGQTVQLRFTATNDASNISSFFVDDIVLSATTASSTTNYTALWWNPAENGWGVNFTHQGNILFGTLFTYDANRTPLWLVMSNGDLQPDGSYSGGLYRTTGPAFNANPFTPITAANYTTVGTMSVSFSGANAGTLRYTVNGVQVTKSIERLVYGARAANCVPTTASRASSTNYQDLWWNAAEGGWGVNVTHQDNTLFATLFTYDVSGRDLWLVMSGGLRQPDGSYLGVLYRASGPAFNANPFTPITSSDLTEVGTMRFQFADGERGTLSYTVNGAPVTKAITRLVFSSPVAACN
jgi:hypothetical protein